MAELKTEDLNIKIKELNQKLSQIKIEKNNVKNDIEILESKLRISNRVEQLVQLFDQKQSDLWVVIPSIHNLDDYLIMDKFKILDSRLKIEIDGYNVGATVNICYEPEKVKDVHYDFYISDDDYESDPTDILLLKISTEKNKYSRDNVFWLVDLGKNKEYNLPSEYLNYFDNFKLPDEGEWICSGCNCKYDKLIFDTETEVAKLIVSVYQLRKIG